MSTDELTNLGAEQALLGAVIYEQAAYRAVRGAVSAEQFCEPFHQRLWAQLERAYEDNRAVDDVILGAAFKGDQAFEELGGVGYLTLLVDKAPPTSTATAYASIISDLAMRRAMVASALEAVKIAQDTGRSAFEAAGHVRRSFEAIEQGVAPAEHTLIDARSSAAETLREIEREASDGKPKGYMTGLRCFDRRLRGLRPGHLIIVGGRPSMAKTALARQAAMGASQRNPEADFAFFALEMDRREIDERTLSELSWRHGDGIQYRNMSGDKLTPFEIRHLAELQPRIPENYLLEDSSSLSVDYVRRRVWSLLRRRKLGAIFIDYLQIMDRPDARGRNDAAVLAQMTKELKQLARSAKIAVVLLSQINRGVEGREDKRPQLSDLRDSGAIEQDANAVLFPFREAYYLERSEPQPGTAKHTEWEQELEVVRRRMDVICAKNRGGAIGTDRQVYFAEFDAIDDDREGSA